MGGDGATLPVRHIQIQPLGQFFDADFEWEFSGPVSDLIQIADGLRTRERV